MIKKQVRMKYSIIEYTKEIPVRARFFAPVRTGQGAHPASYTSGTGSIFRGAALTTHPT
jgi:hypothetical protein